MWWNLVVKATGIRQLPPSKISSILGRAAESKAAFLSHIALVIFLVVVVMDGLICPKPSSQTLDSSSTKHNSRNRTKLRKKRTANLMCPICHTPPKITLSYWLFFVGSVPVVTFGA